MGNKRFRDLVADAVDNYNNAISRLEKAAVVNSIVDEIRAAGGRFLRRDDDEGTWHGKSNCGICMLCHRGTAQAVLILSLRLLLCFLILHCSNS